MRAHVRVWVQESVEDMGLYEEVSAGAGGATVQVTGDLCVEYTVHAIVGILTVHFADNGVPTRTFASHCYTFFRML